LLSKQENILLYDLFNTITATYAEESNAPAIILDWVNCHVHTPINKEELIPFFSHIDKSEIISLETEYKLRPATESKSFKESHSIVTEKADLNSQIDFKNIGLPFQPSPIKILFAGLTLIMIFSFISSHLQPNSVQAKEENIIVEIETPISKHPHLPSYFTYKDVDENKLKAYLKSRNSLLEEEPYFSSIINTALEFDLNPLVLFAIAGHEQGFVPKSNPLATKIANNPFNVFVSWQEYNTDIVDSSQIAARTVINLSKGRPDGVDPFQWINRKYAEDKNWWKGVRSIFDRLEREVNNFSSN